MPSLAALCWLAFSWLLLASSGSSARPAETPAPQPGPRLVNPGFEDPDPLVAWKTWIYKDGKDPVIRADEAQAAEGKRSLLVEASDPADVALGQVVALPPGTVWRASCRIRTENLVARDRTEVGGALHVQTPEGGTVAAGEGKFGTSSWRDAKVLFRVPPPGRVKIVLFYIGYGKGTGKVWFDDIRLEQVSSGGVEEVTIHAERLGKLPVDLKQGGQFIELLCHFIPSMIAQQVASTSFEEDPPWKVTFRPAVDRPHRPWYPDGAVHVARYSFDTETPFNGKRSQRIEITAPHARAGISQDGFYVKEGASYRLRLHMRCEPGGAASGDAARGAAASGAGDARPTVRATLHGGGGLVARPRELGEGTEAEKAGKADEARKATAAAGWQAADAVLHVFRTSENATLTLDFEGPGTVWIDRVYLIEEGSVLGLWRPDVVRAIRELSPGVIRFGGSIMEGYEWDRCVGSWDARAPFDDPYWGGIEENFVGVEEFVALCQAVGAEPLVCVRWSGKKPEDAAAEVEYFNGPPDSKWGVLRARNGRREPYRVKYWQIGNEVGGPQYDASIKAFAEAMRAADASIKVLSAFPSAETLTSGGGYLDYLCPHHYGCENLPYMESDFRSLAERIGKAAPSKPVRVAVTEWNTTAGDWGLGRGMLQTLANALSCSRYHNLMHRHADLVEMAMRSNLVDSFCSGIIVTGPGWLHVTPTYHAQRLYSRAAGSYPIRVERTSGLPASVDEPDLSAVLSEDGRTLRIYGVQRTDAPIEVKVALRGFAGAGGQAPAGAGSGAGAGAGVTGGTVHVLADRERSRTQEVVNSRDDPDRVAVATRPAESRGESFVLRFEPYSLTLYELDVGPPER